MTCRPAGRGKSRPVALPRLGSLNQVTKGLAKTIRAMADGTLDSQVGARICNGLGIMRACLETQKLEQLEARMDEIADRVARNRTNAVRERTSTHEAQRPSH
jgi:glutamate synthase domain-containing protein 2